MITIPPRHYCVIENPVARDGDGVAIMENGQAKLLHADQEFRHAQVRGSSSSMSVVVFTVLAGIGHSVMMHEP